MIPTPSDIVTQLDRFVFGQHRAKVTLATAEAERNRANARRWWAEHKHDPEIKKRNLEKSLTWYRSHREQKQSYDREYRERNRERIAAYRLAWNRTHKENERAHTNRRRARVRNAAGSHTIQEWRDKRILLGNVCIYCGESKFLTRDHNTPLSRGGSDDIANILPACYSCNAKKQHRTAREFIGS